MANSSTRKGASTSPEDLPGGMRTLMMAWTHLLFLHWPVDVGIMRELVPAELELDTFDGQAWIGVVPFRMSGVRPAITPAVPGLSSFLELNVRTYVTHAGESGVYFFSLDASSAAAVWMARTFFHLPYFRARIQMGRRGDGWQFTSRRTHQGAQPGDFLCRWTPGKPLPRSKPGELAHFLMERDRFFVVRRRSVWCCRIHHDPWILREAAVETLDSNVVEAAGFPSPEVEPLTHHSDRLAVALSPLREAALHEEEAALLDPALSPPPATFGH